MRACIAIRVCEIDARCRGGEIKEGHTGRPDGRLDRRLEGRPDRQCDPSLRAKTSSVLSVRLIQLNALHNSLAHMSFSSDCTCAIFENQYSLGTSVVTPNIWVWWKP